MNSSVLIYGSWVFLSFFVEIQSEESYMVIFKWVVYKVDIYWNQENFFLELG